MPRSAAYSRNWSTAATLKVSIVIKPTFNLFFKTISQRSFPAYIYLFVKHKSNSYIFIVIIHILYYEVLIKWAKNEWYRLKWKMVNLLKGYIETNLS